MPSGRLLFQSEPTIPVLVARERNCSPVITTSGRAGTGLSGIPPCSIASEASTPAHTTSSISSTSPNSLFVKARTAPSFLHPTICTRSGGCQQRNAPKLDFGGALKSGFPPKEDPSPKGKGLVRSCKEKVPDTYFLRK